MDLWTRLWGRYHVPQNVFLVLDEIHFRHCAKVFCWYFRSDKKASLPLGEDVKLRNWCWIVSFQYVLREKVTDHSGPEIYIISLQQTEHTTDSCSQKLMLITVLLFNWLNSTFNISTLLFKHFLCCIWRHIVMFAPLVRHDSRK